AILGSSARAELFRLLFDGENRERYLRDLSKDTVVQVSALQKELKHLEALELLMTRIDGNRVYYRANREHPLYLDINSLVEKTVGVVAILKQALVHPKIQCAFIFGSFARGEERAESDIDIAVVGSITMRTLVELISVPQEKLARPINAKLYSLPDFQSRLRSKHYFLTGILAGEIVPLVGNPNDYRTTTETRVNRTRGQP
ncbi:MAG: nucleotidyltransferase domain-containing protein, partial [Bacteriovoracia bacterium]